MMRLMRSAVLIGIGLVVVVVTPSLSGAGQSASGGSAALRVVTSNTVLADFVEQVGGEAVQVRALAPRGADPTLFSRRRTR